MSDLTYLTCRIFDYGGDAWKDGCARCGRDPELHNHHRVETWSPAGPFQYEPPRIVPVDPKHLQEHVSNGSGRMDWWGPAEHEIRGRTTIWPKYPVGDLPEGDDD